MGETTSAAQDQQQHLLRGKLSGAPRFYDAKAGGGVGMIASAKLPTRYGTFTLWGFRDHTTDPAVEYTVITAGTIAGSENCTVRVHSSCHTGDTLSSRRCDCQQQLRASQRYISRRKLGIIVYLPQEGRGIGLVNKIKAYHLQDLGLDTAEANQYLGHAVDERDYSVAAEIIHWFKPRSIRLITNNPEKIAQLREKGIVVSDSIALRTRPNRHNRGYLHTKRSKFKHDL